MPHLEPCESTGVDEVWFRIQEDVWEAPICIDLRRLAADFLAGFPQLTQRCSQLKTFNFCSVQELV